MNNYEAINTKINSFLDMLSTQVEDTQTFPDRPTRMQIVKSSKSLSHEITKISLLLQDIRAKEEFFSNIVECLDNLFSIYQALASYSCQTLFRSIQNYYRKLLKSLLDLFTVYQEQEQSLGEDEENVVSKQVTGLAWKCCEEFEKMPINNTVALYLRSKELNSMIQDALDEMEDIEKKLRKATGELGAVKDTNKPGALRDSQKVDDFENEDDDENEEDDDFEQEDDDDFFDDGSLEIVNNLTKEESVILFDICDCIRVSQKATKLYQEVMKSIQPQDKDDTTNDPKQNANTHEQILNKINELSKNIDDIASAIYPPLNTQYLTSQISIIKVFNFEILSDLKSNFKSLSIPQKFEEPLDSLLLNAK
ncbi:hypothetical protein DLAC_02499 [Tieghemostelium lacteum]|uniref:Uncharacterized protein n=1 Tax=Tieghemostelium lacteum TaxID=361077 RepID=A0A152A2R6_TIELA|nr:hypothetical protein DLAC_02499 [Tieghemostelium lacteum]|eukprot:KYR00494.1 hypothetical protein DLAC_02499 [Tieghemostelium lacteum]